MESDTDKSYINKDVEEKLSWMMAILGWGFAIIFFTIIIKYW